MDSNLHKTTHADIESACEHINITDFEIVPYTPPNRTDVFELRFDGIDDFWLTENEIVELYNMPRQTVNRQLNAAFKKGDLDEKLNLLIFEQVQIEGKREIKRKIKYYNTDAIMYIGYKSNTKEGSAFRKNITQFIKQRTSPTQQQIDIIHSKIRKELFDSVYRNVARDSSAWSYNIMRRTYEDTVKRVPDEIQNIIMKDTAVINRMVFGQHFPGIRDRASPRQLYALTYVSLINAIMLELGIYNHDKRIWKMTELLHIHFQDIKKEQLLPESVPRQRLATNYK